MVKKEEHFVVETNDAYYMARHLIWATGEFKFPNDRPFPGAEVCPHTSRIPTYRKLLGKEFTIIGGYESGVDAALNLALLGKHAAILERGTIIDNKDQDPSVTLSFYTRQRLDDHPAADNILLEESMEVKKVSWSGDGSYRIHTAKGYYEYDTAPILATGYLGGETQIADLFHHTQNRPQLNEWDESTKTENLFLVGPHVMHEGVIFCFIYKFRQRFAIVANRIAGQSGIKTNTAIELYRKNNMFLDNLSCCQIDFTC